MVKALRRLRRLAAAERLIRFAYACTLARIAFGVLRGVLQITRKER